MVQDVFAIFTKVCDQKKIKNAEECPMPFLLRLVFWRVLTLAKQASRSGHWRQALLFEARPDDRAEDPLAAASQIDEVDEVDVFITDYLKGDEVPAYQALRRCEFQKNRTAAELLVAHGFGQSKAYRLMSLVDMAATRKIRADRDR